MTSDERMGAFAAQLNRADVLFSIEHAGRFFAGFAWRDRGASLCTRASQYCADRVPQEFGFDPMRTRAQLTREFIELASDKNAGLPEGFWR